MADEKVKEKKDKEKKRKEPSKARRRVKDFFTELKKVTWPSFPKVIKKTGVVLFVTICFLIVMIAFDSLFGLAFRYLVSGLTDESVVGLVANAFGGGGLL